MSEALSKLIHRRVERADKVHDYVQLRFDDATVLNVFNSFSINGRPHGDPSSLVGCEITETSASDAAICLFLSGGNLLQVGMLETDYCGPEAMEYIAANGARVVWP